MNMLENFDASVTRLERKTKRQSAPAPDFAGWTAEQVLAWAARNGRYEEIVGQANQRARPPMVTPPPPQAPPEAPEAPATPLSSDDAPAAAIPGVEPEERRKAYWEEVCRWRPRGAEDEDRDTGRVGYECDHEYDPFARP